MPKFPVHPFQAEPAITTIVREVKSLWPFVVGFGITGALITQVALGVTDEDVKNSKFANPKGHH